MSLFATLPALRSPHVAFELTRLARAPRTHLVRFLFAGTLVAFGALLWPWTGGHSEMLGGSAEIFRIFFLCEMLLAVLFVPALIAPTIPAERASGTLELLVTCPASEGGIVLGKLFSHGLLALAVLAAGFPVAFACTLLGGVSLAAAGLACVHVLVTAFFAACIGIRCALVWESPLAAASAAVAIHAGAVFASFLATLAIHALLWTGAWCIVSGLACGLGVVSWARWRSSGEFPRGCLAVSVLLVLLVAACASMALPSRLRSRPPAALSVLCPWFLYSRATLDSRHVDIEILAAAWVVHLAAGALLLRSSSRLHSTDSILLGARAAAEAQQGRPEHFVSQWRERKRREEAERRGERDSGERVARVQLVLHPRADVTNPTRLNPYLPVGSDPIYWKETSWPRSPALNRARLALAGFSWLLAIHALGQMFALDRIERERPDLTAGLALAVMAVTVAGSATLCTERSSGTLAVLLSTGYPAVRVVAGKALASLRWCTPVFVPFGLQVLMIGLPAGAPGLLLIPATALAILAALGISVGASALTRNSRLALVAASAGVAALWLLPGTVEGRWPEAAGAGAVSPLGLIPAVYRYAFDFRWVFPEAELRVYATAGVAFALLPLLAVAGSLERQVRA